MAELQGSAAKAAYKKASTWGTAVTLGDGDQVEYASETLTPDAQLVDSDQITGEALSGPSEVGSIIVQGDLAGIDMIYEGDERFLRDVFGSNTTSTVNVTVKQHLMDFEQSNEGFFGTLAIEKVVTGPHEIDSFKPMGLTIVGAPGVPVKMTVRGIGRQLRTKDPDRTNDASTTWTLPGLGAAPSTRRNIKFGHCKIFIAEADNPAPTYPDDYTELCASGFQLSFQRNGDPVPTTCSGDYADEPSTDTVEITGQFDFPIYDSDNDFLVDANLAKTVLTAVIVFDSGVEIASSVPSTNYEMIWWLPAFQLTGGYPNVSGKGRVPLSAAFRVVNADTAVDTNATMPRLYVHNGIADIDDYGNS
jgi:hypothetical protein